MVVGVGSVVVDGVAGSVVVDGGCGTQCCGRWWLW